jgi:molybdenum cofactor biosynthesis enzyme MoaA
MLSPALSPSNLRAWPLPGLPAFVRRLAATGTTRVICTGTTTDPLLYSHLGPLLQALRTSVPRAHVSLHTNGVLAAARAELFNSFDTVTLSLNSFERGVYSELHGARCIDRCARVNVCPSDEDCRRVRAGVRSMPDITRIMRLARVPVKLSCVLTPANSAPADVRAYVDAARRLGVTRIAFRHVHDATAPHDGAAAAAADASGARLFGDAAPLRAHAGNPVYDLGGVEVTHWRFEGTTGRSLNLFADGSLSADYLLARAPGARRA